MHTNTKGGSSETEQNALAVKPQGAPSGRRAVTMVTPVANDPSTRRNSVGARSLLPAPASASTVVVASDSMPTPRRRCWGILLTLAALAGCDNVSWGGADIQIVPPPPPQREVAPAPAELPGFGLPSGPVLFHLVRQGTRALVVPVAEVRGDSLLALRPPAGVDRAAYRTRFRATVFPVGSRLVVYRRGARVGTVQVQDSAAPTPCGLPTAVGALTVVAAAANEPEFLAFREGLEPPIRGLFAAPPITPTLRTYAPIVAERLVLQHGLPRPRSWQAAQRDLQAIDLRPGGHPEMAATFLVGDRLAPGPADPDGYSVFFLADYDPARGYVPIYAEVTDDRRQPKRVLRLVDGLDWDGRPGLELLLQVFTRRSAGYAALSQRRGRWQRIWEDPGCSGPAVALPSVATPSSAPPAPRR